MVDANGAYHPKQALAMAEAFAAERVCWFEEPVRRTISTACGAARPRAGRHGDGRRRIRLGCLVFPPHVAAGAVDVLQVDSHALRWL